MKIGGMKLRAEEGMPASSNREEKRARDSSGIASSRLGHRKGQGGKKQRGCSGTESIGKCNGSGTSHQKQGV